MFLPPGEVYVFDVDGVLIDVRERLRRALREIGRTDNVKPGDLEPPLRQAFWRRFLSQELLAFDKPRGAGIKLLLERLDKGVVVIVTGRPYRLYRATVQELRGAGIPVEKVIITMRPNGDRRKDLDFKKSVLARIPSIKEIHDDELEILVEAKRLHPEAKLYHHFDEGYTEI